jgi:hypothetical protein
MSLLWKFSPVIAIYVITMVVLVKAGKGKLAQGFILPNGFKV